jgi:tRNA (cytidine/uridine-2'-O-)-methyltransferase
MPQKMPFLPVSCAKGDGCLRLALYQPDIPQNAGSLMRLCACLGVAMDLIEPCGFLLSDRNFRRAGMDYLARLKLKRHASWDEFQAGREGRLLLLSTKATRCYFDFSFAPSDTLLLGRESAGVPDDVHRAADERLLIPMIQDLRSINVAQAAAMVLGEGLRQTALFPSGALRENLG